MSKPPLFPLQAGGGGGRGGCSEGKLGCVHGVYHLPRHHFRGAIVGRTKELAGGGSGPCRKRGSSGCTARPPHRPHAPPFPTHRLPRGLHACPRGGNALESGAHARQLRSQTPCKAPRRFTRGRPRRPGRPAAAARGRRPSVPLARGSVAAAGSECRPDRRLPAPGAGRQGAVPTEAGIYRSLRGLAGGGPAGEGNGPSPPAGATERPRRWQRREAAGRGWGRGPGAGGLPFAAVGGAARPPPPPPGAGPPRCRGAPPTPLRTAARGTAARRAPPRAGRGGTARAAGPGSPTRAHTHIHTHTLTHTHTQQGRETLKWTRK